MVIWLGYDIFRQQIGSKKDVQKQNASTISQIKNDYLANFIRITDVFHEMASIYTFLKSGLCALFPILDLRQALYALFSGGKNGRDPSRSDISGPFLVPSFSKSRILLNLLSLRFLRYLSPVFSASKKNPCYFCDFCDICGHFEALLGLFAF